MFVKDRSFDRRLSELAPGLVKLTYFFKGNQEEELALILTPSLADGVSIPNDLLCYRFFLRDGMKAAYSGGLQPYSPFSGLEVHDEHIESVDNRIIQLRPSFCDFEKNLNHLLIPCNSTYFREAIDEVKITLFNAGFNVDTSQWEDYKIWETEKLKTF